MKKIKSLGAILVVLAIILGSVMVGVLAASGSLPQTNTTLDFMSDYQNAISKAVDSYAVANGNQYGIGLYGKETPDSYVVFKMEKNSPVVIKHKYVPAGNEKPLFYASADGRTWTELALEKDSDGQLRNYYTNGIGTDNKYVKIVISDSLLANIWRSDFQSISYNASTEVDELPLTDTVLDFVGKYTESLNKAHDKYEVCQDDNGLLGNKLPDSYVVYKVRENSPVIAKFKWQPTGSEKPLFYTSSDGANWTALSMSIKQSDTQRRLYYSNGIGAGNKYIKIIISDTAGDKWRYDLEELSYHKANISGLENMDTTVNFVNAYADATSKAYKLHSSLFQVYNGGVSGKTPDAYIIYKVQKNSPIAAKFNLYTDQTTGRPEFYASSDAKTWTKLDMQSNQNGIYTTYSNSNIGTENKYVKIIISNVALTASWHSNLCTFSYNKSTETEELPETDTTLDFMANGKADLDRVFRNYNFAIAPPAGYENSARATKANNYIVINTADNSPFIMNMRVHDSALSGKVTLQVTNDPNNPDSWVGLDVTRVCPQKGGFNTWSFQSTGIGEGYTYIKISLSMASAWAFCIEDISYCAGEHIGPDDSGYREPDPDDKLPKTNTTLNFKNDYQTGIENAYMFSLDLFQIYLGGLGGRSTPESHIVYKVDKNSPIVATFMLYATLTKGRPKFYASPDGETWELLTMETTEPVQAQGTYKYYNNGIGAENKYIKIVLSDTKLDVSYHVDLNEISFNGDTEPSPYDLNLNFSSDSMALSRIYAVDPPEAFEHLTGTGLILTVDYLSGQKNVAKPKMVFAVKPGSGILMQYRVSTFAAALDMKPTLYASKDGKKWDAITEYDIFPTGSNEFYTSYRLRIDSLDSKYEFVAFEYPQTQDLAGMEIAELDDYIPDCMNTGIILTNLSFMRSEKYIGLAGSNSETDDTEDDEELDGTEEEPEDDENIEDNKAPMTGDKSFVALYIVLAAISLAAVILLNSKIKKGSRV